MTINERDKKREKELKETFPNPTDELKRELIRKATLYQSGEGLMNTLYMGSMSKSMLMNILGGSYGKDGMDDLISKATSEQLEKGFRHCGHIILYMTKKPRTKCAGCGQIIPLDPDAPVILTLTAEEARSVQAACASQIIKQPKSPMIPKWIALTNKIKSQIKNHERISK